MSDQTILILSVIGPLFLILIVGIGMRIRWRQKEIERASLPDHRLDKQINEINFVMRNIEIEFHNLSGKQKKTIKPIIKDVSSHHSAAMDSVQKYRVRKITDRQKVVDELTVIKDELDDLFAQIQAELASH